MACAKVIVEEHPCRGMPAQNGKKAEMCLWGWCLYDLAAYKDIVCCADTSVVATAADNTVVPFCPSEGVIGCVSKQEVVRGGAAR